MCQAEGRVVRRNQPIQYTASGEPPAPFSKFAVQAHRIVTAHQSLYETNDERLERMYFDNEDQIATPADMMSAFIHR